MHTTRVVPEAESPDVVKEDVPSTTTRRNNLHKALTQDLTSDGDLDMTASEMFELADADADGTISFPEFEKIHQAIGRAAVTQEKKRSASERGRKLMKKISFAVAALFLLMLCGNAALTAVVVFLSKDVGTDASGKLVRSFVLPSPHQSPDRVDG